MSAASLDDLGMDRGLESAVYRHEDFPGCELFHLPAGEVDRYEGRLEFWDGVTETAWKVCEPTSIQHEGPSRWLVQMATRLHSVSARAQAKGHAHGQREGRAQGLRGGPCPRPHGTRGRGTPGPGASKRLCTSRRIGSSSADFRARP